MFFFVYICFFFFLMICFFFFFFFFSSRRRHTRCGRDWSSDVCSSDLMRLGETQSAKEELTYIQQSAPPEAVANIVEQYLGELSGQKRRSSQLKLWEIGRASCRERV